MSAVKNVAERQERQAQRYQSNAGVVESPAALYGSRILGLTEVSKPSASNVSCCSGLASGRVSRAKAEVFVVVDAFEFTGMDVSSVVSAGCGCGPSDNASGSSFNGESVFGFDAVNGIPANCGCNEWVHHSDAFIENQYFGANEAQPSQCCTNSDEAQLNQPSAIAEEENLNSEQQVEQENHTGHNKCGCGSKSVEVGHTTILPLTVKSSSLEGK